MQMFEQAMSMWTSFWAAAQSKTVDDGKVPSAGEAGAADAPREDLTELKAQLAAMQQKIEKLAQDRS